MARININGSSQENPLSFNERLCLVLSFKGEGRKQVAKALNVDIQSIKTYYRRIFDKLEVGNIKKALCVAISKGYLSFTPGLYVQQKVCAGEHFFQ